MPPAEKDPNAVSPIEVANTAPIKAVDLKTIGHIKPINATSESIANKLHSRIPGSIPNCVILSSECFVRMVRLQIECEANNIALTYEF